MFKLVLGSFLSAMALFVFGAAFWTSPLPYRFVAKPARGDAGLGQALRDHLPVDGLYLVPGIETDPKDAPAAYRAGPVATIHFRKGGVEAMSPSVFINGFLQGWAATSLLALLLRLAPQPRYGLRVLVVVTAASASAIYMKLGDGIYWFQPWPWLVLNAAYDVVAFLVAGLVLAAFIKPTPAHA